MIDSLIHLLALATCVFSFGANTSPFNPQAAFNNDSMKDIERPSFGVGFDLTASYGSAAISYANGTTITIARAEAGDGYNEVLKRLSRQSSRHPSPPYNNLGDSWDDMPRQLLRKARKAIGLPASSDVGVLAAMLSDLRAQVEGRVGPIKAAGVTTLNLVALYDEDLKDAFHYLQLEYLEFPVGWVGHNILYETSAAYAGYGFGLCSDYTDPEGCEKELNAMSNEVVMAVLYTPTVLTVSLSVMKSAYGLYEPEYRRVIDFELGHHTLEALDDYNEWDDYWEKVEMKLQQIMIENPLYERPRKVLLMGDWVQRSKAFWDTLLAALNEQMAETPEILVFGAEGVAARGVAELAKRISFKRRENEQLLEL